MSNARKPTAPWLRLNGEVTYSGNDRGRRKFNRRRFQMLKRQINVNEYLLRLAAPLLSKELDQDLALRDMDEHHISSC